ncbi:unnamed protein product [Acanthoscelides obtectus]|uniref:Uncharacterized protein n=1 Tax=Acanthoscelides obtectus TaxID=200917 RepID=A0A9P0QBE9_ACAOB|nr:unnamed protein product [Acanthoscelides obtectus]CAK1623176.1 hypothetical protein AOBTE_LOCUS1859 [Acanthoscelides obtectus]
MQDGERDVRNNMRFLMGSVGIALTRLDVCSKTWLLMLLKTTIYELYEIVNRIAMKKALYRRRKIALQK